MRSVHVELRPAQTGLLFVGGGEYRSIRRRIFHYRYHVESFVSFSIGACFRNKAGIGYSSIIDPTVKPLSLVIPTICKSPAG